MEYPQVDWRVCLACSPCEARLSCKTRAIVQIEPGEPAYIELARCTKCGKCSPACPWGAIEFRNHNPDT